MATVILERSFDPPLTEQRFGQLAARLAPCLDRSGIQWMRSHMSRDRTRLICEFEAPDAGVLRGALRQARIEYDRVWSAAFLRP